MMGRGGGCITTRQQLPCAPCWFLTALLRASACLRHEGAHSLYHTAPGQCRSCANFPPWLQRPLLACLGAPVSVSLVLCVVFAGVPPYRCARWFVCLHSCVLLGIHLARMLAAGAAAAAACC
jgi:hypothetical protein